MAHVIIRRSCRLAALLALAALGCAHGRPASSPFIAGRPPAYVLPPPGQAATAPPAAPTLESSTPTLRQALADLGATPTASRHRVVAALYVRAGALDVAADHYSAAIELEPRDATSYEMRARILREWGVPHLGLGDAYRAIHYGRTASAHNTLGTLFQRMGRTDDARAEYRRALALDPQAAYALANLRALDAEEAAQAAAPRRRPEETPR
jgi:Tfp pilus assembly protein PilF